MTKTIKKISSLSALVLSVGSTIGAGIFFKNATIFANAGGSLAFAVVSWIIAAIGIMALGLAIVEMSSVSIKSKGIVEWVAKFTPHWLGKYSGSYMALIYIPLCYFAMPLYAAMALEDAMGDKANLHGWAIVAIALAFLAWILTMAFFRFKVAEKLQWVFTALKFVPLLLVPIFAIVQMHDEGVKTSIKTVSHGLNGFSPWLGILGSIPAILFAFDGFYTVSSLRDEMAEPQKLGVISVLAVSIISGVYVLFGLILGLAGDGSHLDVSLLTKNRWLMSLTNVLIMIAVLGIINGFAISTPNLFRDIDAEYGVIGNKVIARVLRIKNVNLAAFIASVFWTLLYFIVLTPIGIYVASSTRNGAYDGVYSNTAKGLYTLADWVTNFTSMMVFAFVLIAIVGALRNRFTNKVQVNKKRYFIPAAIISLLILGAGGLYMLIQAVVNIFIYTNSTGVDQKTITSEHTIAIINLLVFIATLVLAALPQMIHTLMRKRAVEKTSEF